MVDIASSSHLAKLLRRKTFLFIGHLTSDDCELNKIGVWPEHTSQPKSRRSGVNGLSNAKRVKSTEKRLKPGRIHAVLTTLGREIAQEVIPAGAVLPPENELEIRFGVGRGVVREAIKMLAGKGLVSVRPRHGTHVLPRRDWSLLDRDVLNWLVGEDQPDRELLLAIQEVRSIIEPAAAALAATRATRQDRQRINAALRAMEESDNQAAATAADKAFHLAILDATHNPVLQGFRGAIDTILSAVFVVAVDSVAGWFEDNIPNHAAVARAIDEGDANKARKAMERVLGLTHSQLSKRSVGAVRRNARPSGSRTLRQA
jgi:GntR family galactonate operon transcriptional repressor